MQPSTHKAWNRFLEAAEREGLTVEDVANLLHHQAYEFVKDCCGPSNALRWQQSTAKLVRIEGKLLEKVSVSP